MEAEGGKLNKVFINNRALRIPYFQRSYVWTEIEWKRLTEDIQYVAQVRKPYFLGSIILKTEDVTIDGAGEQYFVVDGQQRLTTLVIFYRALFTVMGKDDEFRQKFIIEDIDKDESERNQPILVHNKFDRLIFNKICNEQPLTLNEQENSYQIAKAYNFFLKFLNRKNADTKCNLDESIRYNSLYIALRDYIVIVTILLSANENEQQIFDTINAAGRKLTTGELLKNFFFHDRNENIYNDKWSPIFDQKEELYKYWTSTVTSGKTSDNNIEAFFYALMQIIICDRNLQISAFDKKIFRHRDGGMFNNYKSLINNYNINKDEFIYTIVDYADIYHNSLPTDTLKETITSDLSVRRLRNIMFASKSWTLVPYLLYVLKNVTDGKEQKKIFGYLESYIMRRMICKTSNNNYSDFFSENLIGQEKKTYQDLKNYVDEKSSNDSLAMPDDETVRKALSEKDLSGNTAQIILYMLESKLSGEKAFPCFDSFYTIPLIPKSSNNGRIPESWPLKYDAEQRDCAVKTLGNWVLCKGKKLNKKTIEAPWITKKTYIKDALECAKKTNANIVNDKTELDEDFIEERCESLHSLIIKVWSSDISEDQIEDTEDKLIKDLEQDTIEDSISDLSDIKDTEILNIDENAAELLPSFEENIWDLLHDSSLRTTYRKYLMAKGTNASDVSTILFQINLFLLRIKSSISKEHYCNIKEVTKMRELFNNQGELWRNKSKYPQQHLFCIDFLNFIQKKKSGVVSSDINKTRIRNRTKIQLTIDGRDELFDPTDALEKVVRLIGFGKVIKDKTRLANHPILSVRQINNFRNCGNNYWLNNGGSTKDKCKVINQLNVIHKLHIGVKLEDV